MKIVRSLFIAVAILAIFVPFCVADSGDYEHKIVNYVALGDSIAKGYGLDDVEHESYVGRVSNALGDKYGAVHLTNFGENGLTSEDLLEILTDEDNEEHDLYLRKIREADIITLSIGSNDLLQYLSQDIDIDNLRENGDKIFLEACENFEKNIPQIVDVINENAPDAQLFVNNIYNPCNDISFGIAENIADNIDVMAELYIGKLNSGFYTDRVQSVFRNQNKGKKSKEYVLVDVKSAFEKSDKKLINMVFSWGNIDPHPNREGHRIISDLIIKDISLQKME